jgi:hypothetical protein
MISLTRSLALVEVGKGLFLDSFTTVVYPAKHLAKDNALQWHLELKPESEDGSTTHYSQTMSQHPPREWYKTLDGKKLASSRLFLGWTPRASVKTGSDSAWL